MRFPLHIFPYMIYKQDHLELASRDMKSDKSPTHQSGKICSRNLETTVGSKNDA